MLVTPLVLIHIFSKRMLVDWPNVGLTLEMRVTWHVCNAYLQHLAHLCLALFHCGIHY